MHPTLGIQKFHLQFFILFLSKREYNIFFPWMNAKQQVYLVVVILPFWLGMEKKYSIANLPPYETLNKC